jgi:hypothetical protein
MPQLKHPEVITWLEYLLEERRERKEAEKRAKAAGGGDANAAGLASAADV